MSWSGEVSGGGVFVLVKNDDGQSFPSAWLPNSYRFASEKEAETFIKHLRKSWIPADFVREVRTIRSKDPVNARWDDRKQEVVFVPAAPASVPVVLPAAALEPVEPE